MQGYIGKTFILSNGEQYQERDVVWVEVLPVKWLVDEKEKIMLTDKLIFSGVQFYHSEDYQTEDFDKTDIAIFMNQYFAKDLEQLKETTSLE